MNRISDRLLRVFDATSVIDELRKLIPEDDLIPFKKFYAHFGPAIDALERGESLPESLVIDSSIMEATTTYVSELIERLKRVTSPQEIMRHRSRLRKGEKMEGKPRQTRFFVS